MRNVARLVTRQFVSYLLENDLLYGSATMLTGGAHVSIVSSRGLHHGDVNRRGISHIVCKVRTGRNEIVLHAWGS